MKTFWSLAALLFMTPCCFSSFTFPQTTVATPVQAPVRRMPLLALKPAPLVPGRGRFTVDCEASNCGVEETLDTSEGSVYVSGAGTFASGSESRRHSRVLCTSTPCWFDLDYGSHNLVVRPADHERFCDTFGSEPCDYATGKSFTVSASDTPTVVQVRIGRTHYAEHTKTEHPATVVIWQPNE